MNDPNQALNNLLENFAIGEMASREDAVDTLCSLADWLRNDGFMPTVEAYEICGDRGGRDYNTWLVGVQQ